MTAIHAILNAATRYAVRGLAVVALVVVWSFNYVGTYVLSVAGISTAALLTTTATADAQWWGWRRRRWYRYRRWRRWW